MTLTTSPARRGNGTAVHTAIIDGDNVLGTRCFLDANYIHGRNHQTVRLLPVGTAITCKMCGPDEAPAAELTYTCPSHPLNGVWRDRETSLGLKRTWNCGCSVTV